MVTSFRVRPASSPGRPRQRPASVALGAVKPQADRVDPLGRPIDQAVDQVAVDQVVQLRDQADRHGARIDDHVDHALVELRDAPRGEQDRPHEDHVVQFVEVPLVHQELIDGFERRGDLGRIQDSQSVKHDRQAEPK
jgi:hypothetical protein